MTSLVWAHDERLNIPQEQVLFHGWYHWRLVVITFTPKTARMMSHFYQPLSGFLAQTQSGEHSILQFDRCSWHLVDSGLLSGPWGTWAVPVMAHHLRVPYVYSSMNFPWTLLTHTVSGLTHMIVATLAHYLIKLTPALKHQSGLYKMATHITMMYSYVLLIRLWVPESGLISVPSKSYQPGQRLCKFLGWFFFRFPLKYKTAYHLSFCVPSGVYLSWRVSSGSDEEWW